MVNFGPRVRLIAIAAAVSLVGLASENVVRAAWQERGWSSGQSGYSTASLPDSFAPVWTNTSDTSQVSNTVIESGGAQCSVSDSSYVATFLYQSNGLARIAIFNARTGSLIWKESTARSWVHCPAIGAGGTSVVGRTKDLYGTNLVRMYDIASGSLMWSRVSGVWDGTTPVVAGGKVLVTNTDVGCTPASALLGISAMDHTGVIWTAASSREFPPVTDGDFVYMADCNGDIVKRSMVDGSVLWTRTITPAPQAILLSGSHVIVNKSAQVMGSSNEGFVSLNASNGAVEWSYILPQNVQPDARAISASPTMVVARIMGNTDSALSALDIEERQALLALNVTNGQKIWARGIALPHRFSGPYIIGSRVFQPMHPNSSTSFFNLTDGVPIATNLFDVSSVNAGAPALVGNEMISWVQLSESDTGLKTLALRRLGQNQIPGTTIPTIASVTSSNVSVEWPVVSNSGTDIIDYEIQVSSTETFDQIIRTVTATSRTALIDGLTAGDTVYARLRARNSLGHGLWSTASVAAVLSTVTTTVAPTTTTIAPKTTIAQPSTECTKSTIPPKGNVGISINAAVAYTNSKKVKLSIVWPACAITVTISNDGGFGSIESFPVKAEIDWELDDSVKGVFTKVAYMRFSGSGIDNTKTYSDDIILDTNAPVINSSSAVATSSKIEVKVDATDDITGVEKIEIDNGAKVISKDYSKIVEVSLSEASMVVSTPSVSKSAAQTLQVRVRDGAGNWTKWENLFLSGKTAVVAGPSSSKAMTLDTKKAVTGKSIAQFAKLVIPKNSKLSLNVALSSKKICRVIGTSIRGLKAGTCKVTVSAKPKTGKTQSKTVSLKVSK